MRYSIIIPTYNKCDELLKPCLESILKFTTVNTQNHAEIIVVANGCTDNTLEYIESLKREFHNIFVLQNPEPMGFTRAVNWGMAEAQGEYFIIMNNDTILLDQPYNQWLEVLNKPFKDSIKTGVTGPMKAPNDATGLPFLLFFCVMISRKCYDKIGPLDEIFSPGYGEDTDYCLRAESMGFTCPQVPVESNEYYADKRMVGNFPIYHAGNQTFKDHPDAELIHRNNALIKERWGTKVDPFVASLVSKDSPKWVENYEAVKHLLSREKEAERAEIDRKIAQKYAHLTPSALEFEEFLDKPVPVDISKAQKCDGYIADSELEWLAIQAKTHKIIIEVGSWHGKSSRALGDNLMDGGKLLCVDHWRGSETERDNNHQSANWEDGDHAHLEWYNNMKDLLEENKIYPFRLSSANAAKLLRDWKVEADMIFIDAGHTEEEVLDDVIQWLPCLAKGGLICGHDAYHVNNVWPGVLKAVKKIFGDQVHQAPNTSIWMVQDPSTPDLPIPAPKPQRPPCIFDCFPYNNEVEVLLERFKTLYDTVDRFIIVEARVTHAGQPKELTFEKNLPIWGNYINKVSYYVIDSFPEQEGTVTDKSWARERYQRDYILNGLSDCQDDDIIIISDCDEIPNPTRIKDYGFWCTNHPIGAFEMDLYYYNEHTKAKDKWYEARITTYKKLKELGPCGIRYAKKWSPLPEGGRHLSYFGGVESIIKKIEDTAHQEYNTDRWKAEWWVKQAIQDGRDIFGRESIKFERV